MIVVSTVGNSLTPCMRNPDGSFPVAGTPEFFARYESSLRQIADAAAGSRRAVRVHLGPDLLAVPAGLDRSRPPRPRRLPGRRVTPWHDARTRRVRGARRRRPVPGLAAVPARRGVQGRLPGRSGPHPCRARRTCTSTARCRSSCPEGGHGPVRWSPREHVATARNWHAWRSNASRRRPPAFPADRAERVDTAHRRCDLLPRAGHAPAHVPGGSALVRSGRPPTGGDPAGRHPS